MKENSGKAFNNALRRRAKYMVLFFSLLVALRIFFLPKTPSPVSKKKRQKKFPTASQQKNHNTNPAHLKVREAQFHLIDIHPRGSGETLFGDNSKPYNVEGVFCQLDWNLHKENPNLYPMFRDLVSKSERCGKTTFRADLSQMVAEARDFDENGSDDEFGVRSMPPAGFVFHESRVGSTLAANSLAAFNPAKNRVYSESGPPVASFRAYDPKYHAGSVQLIQDVIYMMGRTNAADEKHLFFKIQSIGCKSIGAFRAAFPDTAWIFLYRDPVEVMMSHLKVPGTKQAVCLRSKNSPPPDFVDLVKRRAGISQKNIRGNLSAEEFCAAHLATLCEAVLRQVKVSGGTGKVVNYEDLPRILIDNILPNHFLIEDEDLTSDAKERISKVASQYSKARRGEVKWEDDRKHKNDNAWPEMRSAVSKFLQPSSEELQKIRAL